MGQKTLVNGMEITDLFLKVPLMHSEFPISKAGELPNLQALQPFSPQSCQGKEALNRFFLKLRVRRVCQSGEFHDAKPNLAYLQGGPGFGCGDPISKSGWLEYALQHYHVFFIDQRGTGFSDPVTLKKLGEIEDEALQTDYLACFRADSIIKDFEWVRLELAGAKPWSLLGQSFGGFCSLTYLSYCPGALNEVFITGGIPGIDSSPLQVYEAIVPELVRHNICYFQRFPGDQEMLRRICLDSQQNSYLLSDGTRLSPKLIGALGRSLGLMHGMEKIHFLLASAYTGLEPSEPLSEFFLQNFEEMISLASSPIYLLLHESIYCQGSASTWAAQRALANFPSFLSHYGVEDALPSQTPLYFTGEMMFPFLVEEVGAFKGLTGVAQRIAEKSDWGKLYRPATLEKNQVPVAAAIYYHDLCVPRVLSENSAAKVGNLSYWITNEFNHSGLRMDGIRILKRLREVVLVDGCTNK